MVDVKRVVIKDREYLEVPADLRGKKLMIVKLGEGLYLVGREESVQETIKRQVVYLLSRKRIERDREKKPFVQRERTVVPGSYSEKLYIDRGGFWVFDTEQEALLFSKRHIEEFQSGDILGIKGFDGKYYAVRKQVYDYLLPKVISLVKESPKTVEELSTLLKKDKNLIKAVLELAREEGLVVERKGGIYEYAA